MDTTDLAARLSVALSAFGAGLALGFLLAPDSGSATRARLSDGAREAASTASERSREWASPVTEAARQSAQHLAERHLPLADDLDLMDGRDLREAVKRSTM
ncbi:MAG: YtxH domain-containing protein [Bacteroidota bacterium]